MKYFIFLLFVVCCCALDRDYCIWGGGAAGSNAAVYLRDRNYTVVILEARDNLGGHCDTIKNGNSWNEAGVVVFPNTTLANARGYGPYSYSSVDFVRRFAGNDSIIPEIFSGMRRYAVNMDAGISYGQVFSSGLTPQQLIDYNRYVQLMNTTYKWMDTMTNVPETLPAGLNLSMSDWIIANNFTSIMSIFLPPLFYGGFGSFNTITALDGLLQRTMTSLMYGQPGAWFSIKNGCQSMYDGIANYIGSNSIRYGVEIESIKRPNRNSLSPIRIFGTDNNGFFRDTCKNLIVAVPPTLSNLDPMQLDYEEYDIFSKVSTKNLFVGYYNPVGGVTTDPSPFSMSNVVVGNPNSLPSLPNLLVSFRKDADAVTVFQSYSENYMSTLNMKALVSAKLNNIVSAGVYSNVSNIQTWLHTYNPHWTKAALGERKNPYYRIQKKQGKNRTLWIGAALTTPISIVIWEHINHLLGLHLQCNQMD